MSKNILVLHGSHQNGDIFRYNCKQLRDVLKIYGTLHFITATIPYQNEYSDDVDLYGWWDMDDNFSRSEESIQQLKTVFNKYGPFDGIIGFSQGAMMITLLCALQHNDVENYKWFDPKFIINICGHDIDSLRYNHLFNNLIDIPTLHIIGMNDEIKDYSIELSQKFKNPIVKLYPNGHEIPIHTNFHKDVIEFIQLHDYFTIPFDYNFNCIYEEDEVEKDFFYI